MTMRSLLSCLAMLLVIACQQTRQLETVPDKSGKTFILDSLLNYSSEAELIREFGAANIARDTAFYPEGDGHYLITLLYPGTEKEVEFTWNDTIHFSSLSAVTLHEKNSPWKTSEGITIGTTLATLVDINKKDVEFSGLEWDYGGAVFWNNGVLQHRGLSVTLGLPENYDNTVTIDSLLGDQRVVSNSAIAKKINPVVIEVMLIKENE